MTTRQTIDDTDGIASEIVERSRTKTIAIKHLPVYDGPKWLDRDAVLDRTGLSDAELDSLVKAGKFPRPLVHGDEWPIWCGFVIHAWQYDQGEEEGDSQ